MTEASLQAAEKSSATGFRVVQTTLMHADQEHDVRALYMGGITAAGGGTAGASTTGAATAATWDGAGTD